MNKLVFKKINLADELFIIVDTLNDKEYNKVIEYARMHGKKIRFLSQTPLNNLINEYRKIGNYLRNMRKNIITYRIGLEDAVENGDVENIKYYSEQFRRSIIEYNDLRRRYYEVKGEVDGHDYELTEDDVRRWSKYILESHNIPLTKENIDNLTETIIYTE